jgi:hypothetical protein
MDVRPWYLILREELRMGLFANRVLRILFGPEGEELRGC